MPKSYTVKVIDNLEGQLLYECPLEEQDKAFEYARQMEELGLDVKIESPSVPESLARVLGAGEEEIRSLRHQIDEEIDSHNPDSCRENHSGDETEVGEDANLSIADSPTSTLQ